MKPVSTLLLAGSVTLNAALAWLCFASRTPSPTTLAPRPAPLAAGATPKIDATIWPAFADTDLPALIARLRAAGFPPDVVRAIIAGQIEDLFAARQKALLGTNATEPFWKNLGSNDPKIRQALLQLDREKQKMLSDLLGREDRHSEELIQFNQGQGLVLGFLGAEKAAAVRRLLEPFEERRLELSNVSLGDKLPALLDQDKVFALIRESRDALAAILTPAELLESDLRNSPTGRALRNELSAFQPTEAEYRALYPLRAAFDERFPNSFGSITLSPEARRERTAAQQLLTDQIKATLGEPRGSEYERAMNYDYARATELVARLALPPETTNSLWAVQKEFEPRYRDLSSNSSASRDQTEAQRAALYQEALGRLTSILGSARTLEAYRDHGGSWLQNLTPRAPTLAGGAPKKS